MVGDPQAEVTLLLEEIRAGSADARSKFVELVYDELRGRASGLMRHERAGQTLQPTELVYEALFWLLSQQVFGQAQNRAHQFAAARAMRQILVDHARQRAAEKRGAGQKPMPLDLITAEELLRAT